MSTKAQGGRKSKPQIETTDVPEPSALWRRLVAAVRGGVDGLGDVIADSQALRILDEEIRDNDAELRRVRTTLAETMARCKVAQERLASANARLEEYEGYALKALKSGEDALARDVAGHIALLEIERDGHAAQVREFTDGIAQLRKVAANFEANIGRLKQQVDTVRATETVQRAQVAMAQRRRDSDGRVRTALDSLERIKRRQAERGVTLDALKVEAGDELDASLEARLRRAGIIAEEDRTEAVLSRLKDRQDE
ncbi:MAG: PspA/IM30 family protein [Xanthomonadaceae bacterium]|nr:PspA/IM30 family protein [Xanthomonadaceae bacterium]